MRIKIAINAVNLLTPATVLVGMFCIGNKVERPIPHKIRGASHATAQHMSCIFVPALQLNRLH